MGAILISMEEIYKFVLVFFSCVECILLPNYSIFCCVFSRAHDLRGWGLQKDLNGIIEQGANNSVDDEVNCYLFSI